VPKRRYRSDRRRQMADVTRRRVISSAKRLFAERGIDKVTIASISARAGVATSTVFALYKSKDGILQAIMREALFGEKFQSAQALMADVKDPVSLVALTPRIARAIYESESRELGLIRGASAFSPALRKIEAQFEKIRFDMQEQRIQLLFGQAKAKKGINVPTARRIMWMYTSRDVYRMLVQEGGWSPTRYEQWLSVTLLDALVNPEFIHTA
jgi:AcrR family transcriptional regulator